MLTLDAIAICYTIFTNNIKNSQKTKYSYLLDILDSMGVLEVDFCFEDKYSLEFKYSLEVKRPDIFAKHFENKSMAIDIDVNSQKVHVLW